MAVALGNNRSPNFLSEELAPRRSIKYYQDKDSDTDKWNEQIEKDINFATTMMLENAKNQLPDLDGNGGNNNIASEMLQTTNTMAQLRGLQVQNKQMNRMVDAMTNPGYSATDIQGQEIEYDDGTRSFDGKNPVEFGYKLNFDEKFKNGTVNTTVSIKDKDGKIIYTGQGSSNKGDNVFVWDGTAKGVNKNNKYAKDGQLMPIGSYTIEVKATGKTANNQNFSVTATTTKTDIVTSVDLNNGIATKVHLKSGRTIDKSQVQRINLKAPEILPDVKADVNMIGKNVSLDFSKAIVKDGKTTLNYSNNIRNSGDVKISFSDDRGRVVKNVNYTKGLKFGEGQINLNNEIEDLKDGRYTVSIAVKDNDNDKTVTLEKNFNTRVVGVHIANNTIHDTEGKIYSADMIEEIEGDYTSPLDQARTAWLGKEVEFEIDEFTFKNGKIEIDHSIPKESDSQMLSKTRLWVYNSDGDVVNIMNYNINPMEIATDEGKEKIKDYAKTDLGIPDDEVDEFVQDFADTSDPKKVQLHNEAFKILLGDANLVTQVYKDATNTSHKFEWDGDFDTKRIAAGANTKAEEGDIFNFKIEYIYTDAAGGEAAKNGKFTDKGVIGELSENQFKELSVKLEDGRIIPENKVISAKENSKN